MRFPSIQTFDSVLDAPVRGTRLDDTISTESNTRLINTFRGDDDVTLSGFVRKVVLAAGADSLTADGYVQRVQAGLGDDDVTLNGGAHRVFMGVGDDTLTISQLVGFARGGSGDDMLRFEFNAGDVDIDVRGRKILFIDRFTGEEMTTRGFETFEFADRSFTRSEILELFGSDAEAPTIQVGGGTQTVTINDPDPTISVIWDRVVQQAIIETDSPTGPTVASRAYSMMHTAMYDAWSAFDANATFVSFDADGDNQKVTGSEANKMKAMSFAAFTVLNNLFPDQAELFAKVMETRLGYSLDDDGSREASIGIDAGEELLALRENDGSNQSGGYAGEFTPTNPNPLEINDITAWTPENVPIDPEDASPEQSFLTPQWLNVESFALAETADGSTNFDPTLPPPPKPFFAEEFAGSTLNFDGKTITLDAPVTVGGQDFAAGDAIPVSQDLIGVVINQGFIDQALEVIEVSANLSDEGKIFAEFWEDGGGTAFPPGTFMSFAQFTSARDGNTLDEDAQLFLAMANAVFDAGIATWQAKVEYDYVRPVRAIRDLGELGLIGEEGVDEVTGETGFVIEAFGGFDPETGEGLGAKTILAENFVTFQRPGADPSPPFSEYTSGHSAFSAAGAEVLRQFTGSDDFGGSVTFAADSIQFEAGVPSAPVTLGWETYAEAADEAGFSRLFGGIHFTDGDLNGRDLGRTVGASAFELAQLFISGDATDADRPFFTDDLIL